MRKEETVSIDLLHRPVPAKYADEGLRTLSGNNPIRPESVQKYLEGKFGDALEDVSTAMLELAKSLPPSQLAEKAYGCKRNSGLRFLPGKRDGGLTASWTSTSSAGWLRPDPEEVLFNCADLCLIRQTGAA